uniref:Zinc knuckle CX2CX4HX4C domain-containing protein n=1 Tax=Cannabis sativa TaxID=3483 RepID=A0A803NVX1_CANSA
MNTLSGSVVEEMIEEVENFSLEDFSIQVQADDEAARATVASTVVGRFFSKKMVSNGTLRKALSGMWKLSRGWRLQSPAPKTFIFRLNHPREVKYILENGPWNPCGGFMMAVALPEDGKWESADFSGLEIWVKALGIPMAYLTDDCVKKMANRMGTLVRANKVRHNGIIVKDYLRFQVRINLQAPLLAGVSLPDLGNKKVWSYFKYERLPLFCYKCGVIGHEEEVCSGRKRMVAVHDGRTIPMYGPWLKDGSRLDNGFALLEVEDLEDRRRLEKQEIHAPNNVVSPKGVLPRVDGSDDLNMGLESRPLVGDNGGSTRVEKEGMEGVVSQRSDNSFDVVYNDYVDCSHFPTQHVVHVANIFKEKLGPIKFGAPREDGDSVGTKSGISKKLKKPRVVGPRGIPRPPIFGRSMDELELAKGNKRKKASGSFDPKKDFVDESQGQVCFIGVDKTGVKDVFGEVSGVNQSIESDSRDEGIDQSKKARLITQALRSEESSFDSANDSEALTRGVLGVGDHVMGASRGESQVVITESAPARLGGLEKVESSAISDARTPLILNKMDNDSAAKKALRALVHREDSDVLFLMETKVNSLRMNGIWRGLGFGGAAVSDAFGSAGGTCLCWKVGVDIQILGVDPGVALALFANVLHGPNWYGLFVYGPPTRAARKEFWEERTIEILALRHPWLLAAVVAKQNIRICLSKWNKTHFGMCEEKLRILNKLLIEIQGRVPSDANLKLEADIVLEIEEVEARQAEIWKQKSRELWYRNGDRNTKFFHAATVIKRKRNFISAVCVDALVKIPAGKDPEDKKMVLLADDLLLGLCNFTYKIISKLLANRFALSPPKFNSPFNAAFVHGRWISENSIMAHEVLDSFKKLKGRGNLKPSTLASPKIPYRHTCSSSADEVLSDALGKGKERGRATTIGSGGPKVSTMYSMSSFLLPLRVSVESLIKRLKFTVGRGGDKDKLLATCGVGCFMSPDGWEQLLRASWYFGSEDLIRKESCFIIAQMVIGWTVEFLGSLGYEKGTGEQVRIDANGPGIVMKADGSFSGALLVQFGVSNPLSGGNFSLTMLSVVCF